jgi:putative ABC transport system permease protein
MFLFNNIKYSIRNLLKSKAVSILNLVGLTVGITVSMLIFLFVLKEKHTDESIPDVHNIYVLTNNGKMYFSQNMVNHVKKEISEMDDVTYCCPDWSPQVMLAKDQENYKVNKMITADSCFFRVFKFKTVWGNPETSFSAANKIVLTRSLSEKIFGKENSVGKTLTYNATYLQGEELEVVAVIEDFPQTVSWEFDAVLSFQTNYKISWYVGNLKNWGSRNYRAFSKVNEHAPEQSVLSKLSHINLAEVPADERNDISYGMTPFEKVYFDLPELDVTRHGNKFMLWVCLFSSWLVLIM